MRALERCLHQAGTGYISERTLGTSLVLALLGRLESQHSERNDQIARPTKPCQQGPQLQISMEEAKQAREIPGFIHDSRKNLLEMQQTLPSCLAPFMKAPLQKDQTQREKSLGSQGHLASGPGSCCGGQADRLFQGMPFCLSEL